MAGVYHKKQKNYSLNSLKTHFNYAKVMPTAHIPFDASYGYVAKATLFENTIEKCNCTALHTPFFVISDIFCHNRSAKYC
jgi:hypothetical protein